MFVFQLGPEKACALSLLSLSLHCFYYQFVLDGLP